MNLLNTTFSINRLQEVQGFASDIFLRKIVYPLTTQGVVYSKRGSIPSKFDWSSKRLKRKKIMRHVSLTVALKGEMLYFAEKHKLMRMTLREMPKPVNPRD